ncbi:YfcC family protein [Arabiibacter massiliensis]|uniref:YfcC family protein n=1 Tax=Arabiibacter massiliensis TaxID=1870985 RepID=UPI0009BC5143|nr:YfcC family protein [Arabiibacter massiliensis]
MPDEAVKKEKKQREPLSSYSILFIIIIIVGLATVVCSFITPQVTAATLPEILDSSVEGLIDAAEISFFLLILGGCLGMVTKIGALDAGITALVRKMHGHELLLIPIIMAIFALLGSSYGFCEEAVPFYALLSLTMVAAGFDTMVAVATVLLGAGVGCLGSTVNPFANGVAIDTLKGVGIEANPGVSIVLGLVLLAASYALAVFFVMRYARKVKAEKGSTILSLQEQKAMQQAFGTEAQKGEKAQEGESTPAMTRTQAVALALFGLSFLIMIIGFIPWQSFGVDIFTLGGVYDEAAEAWTVLPWSAWVTGAPLGEWYFKDASVWFLVMSIVIGVVARMSERQIVDAWIDGAADMVGVALVVGLARAISILMAATHLDVMILDNASHLLAGSSAFVFAPVCYLIFLGLSFIITSTSALATLSMPIMGSLATSLGFSPDVMVMIFVAANGLANLFSPTAAFLPGLMMAKVEYGTWLKWAVKPIIVIGLASVVVLTAAMVML